MVATISLSLGEFLEKPNGMLELEDLDMTFDTGLLGDIWQEGRLRNSVRDFYPLVTHLGSRPYELFRKDLESLGGTSLVLYQELQGLSVELEYRDGKLVLDKNLNDIDGVPVMVEALVKVNRCKVKGVVSQGIFYANEYVEQGFEFSTVLSNLEYLGTLGFEVVPYNTLDLHSVEELDELVVSIMEDDYNGSLGVVLSLNDINIAKTFSYRGFWIAYRLLGSKVYRGFVQYVDWSEDFNGILRPFAYVAGVQDVARFEDRKGNECGYYDLIASEGLYDLTNKVKNLEEIGVRTSGAKVVKYVPLHNIATMVSLGVNYQSELYFRVYKGLVFPTDSEGHVLFDTYDI